MTFQIVRFLNISVAVIVLMVGGCASPTSPSGGPPDKSPPKIVRTVPESGTTHFDSRVVELHFNEFVERPSLSRALSLAPNLGIEYSLDWGRKSVNVVFEQSLPDSTTFILSIGTEFQDVRGNAIGSPVKIAISTGPTIDQGRLIGFIKKAESGQVESGMTVMLYEKPVDLSSVADYTTETDTGGQASFPYLGPGTYKAFWVDDRNRNRKWDPDQERAQPFPEEFRMLEAEETDTLGTLYVHRPDTSRPELVGVGLFTDRRLRFRFSESVLIDSLEAIQVRDSASQTVSNATALYQPKEEQYVLFAHSDRPLHPDSTYSVDIKGLTDLNGNSLLPTGNLTFTGTSQEDTVTQRIIRMKPENGIYSYDPVSIVYATPITDPIIRDSLLIVEGQNRRPEWKNITVESNQLTIRPDSLWQKGISHQFMPWNPKKADRETFQTNIWHKSDLGSLHFMRSDTTDTTRYKLNVSSADKRIVRNRTVKGELTLDQFPPMRYRVIAYLDRDGDGEWDAGSVTPFNPPEPYYVRSGIPVQPGFTSDLTIRFTGID